MSYWVKTDDEFIVKKATEKAILVEKQGARQPEKHWLPLSQIHEDCAMWDEGEKGHLVIPSWLAEEKGLHAEEYYP